MLGKPGWMNPLFCHEHSRTMQRGFALHGVDEGHVVHALCELRKQITHPASTLSVLTKGPVALLTRAGFRREELQFAIGVEGLALALGEFWFVVPSIDMRETARAEDLNHGLGFRRMMPHLGSEGIGRGMCLVQHRREGDTTKTSAEFPEKITAGDGALLPTTGEGCVHGISRGKQTRLRS